MSSEIVGNRIMTKGEKINSLKTNNRSILRYINAIHMINVGELLILKKNNNA
jgi:hypothetical protein